MIRQRSFLEYTQHPELDYKCRFMEKIYIHKIIYCLLLVFILLVFPSCERNNLQQNNSIPQKQSTFEKVKKTGILKVGYIVYPPTVQRDPNTGVLSGHYVDAVEEIAKQMNLRIEYHEAEWGTFIAGLKSGKFDLSIAATYRTIPRAQEVAFTRPLMYIGNSVIVKANEKRFNSIEDFNQEGLTIAVTQGEQGHEYAKMYLSKAKLTVLSTADQSLAFTEVSTGRADAALGDSWACEQYATKHPEVKDLLADNPYNLTPVGWAVRYDDLVWLEFINTALDALDSTGKLRDFETKHGAHWIHPKISWEIW